MTSNQHPSPSEYTVDEFREDTQGGDFREDGWWNSVTGAGAPGGKDTSTHFRRNPPLQFDELAAMYYQDDLANRIVGKLPREALKREPRIKNTKATPEQVKQVQKRLTALSWIEKFQDAATFGRLFGNAGVLVATDSDQETPAQPREKPLFLRTVDRRSMLIARYYVQPRGEKHGQPEAFGLIPVGSLFNGAFTGIVHETRIRMFRGTRLDPWEKAVNGGWDYSVLQTCINVVRDMGETWGGISYLLRELSLKIFKTKDLAKQVATAPALVRFRLDLLNQVMATNRMMAIDKESEDFTRSETGTLTGVSALLEMVLLRVSAAADMPVTQLYGRSPSGLSATGENDREQWKDSVSCYQEQELKPRMLPVLQQVAANEVPGIDPETWELEFQSPYIETDEQKRNGRKAIIDMDSAAIGAGMFSPEQLAVKRAAGDWNPDYDGVDTSVQKALITNPGGGEDPAPVPAPGSPLPGVPVPSPAPAPVPPVPPPGNPPPRVPGG